MPATKKTPYSAHLSVKETPQTEPIPGSTQVTNTGGGYSWLVDKWKQLDRFLILGAEGGTFYISEPKLVKDNAAAVIECIKENGIRVIDRAVEISTENRAPKNDPAVFVLALACAFGSVEVKKHGYARMDEVVRIPTHLFHFAQYCADMRGWGSGLKRAIANWYNDQDAERLAYTLVKYRQRDGWTHLDLLRLSHPGGVGMRGAPTPQHAALYRWATSGPQGMGARTVMRRRGKIESTKKYKAIKASLPGIVVDFETLTDKSEVNDVIPLIEKHNFPHEAIPTHLKSNPKIWEALLQKGMPMTAMLRNLANMTRIGTLVPLNDNVKIVTQALRNEDFLKKARVHPVAILNALKTYASGRSLKGDNTWSPLTPITDALDDAFYKSFKFVEPTGKSFMLALDISGSMAGSRCNGAENMTCREATAAMSLVTANVEDNYYFVGFDNHLIDLAITPKMRMDACLKYMSNLSFGSTDCALPITNALKRKLKVDTFCVYTDNETNSHHSMHAAQALVKYRKEINPAAKLVVCGMACNPFTIADPNDAGMLDVVGFDTNVPAIIADFSR